MTTCTYFIIGFISLALLVWLAWRLASRRQSLPCPVWLRWLVELDNPFTQTNRAHVIIRHLDLQPGMTVLDAGCKPGGLLSITEIIFDPHFQSRRTVRQLAQAAGFKKQAFFGNRLAYTLHFAKP